MFFHKKPPKPYKPFDRNFRSDAYYGFATHSVPDDKLMELGERLKTSDSLKYIHFSAHRFNEACLQGPFNALITNTSVTHLHLDLKGNTLSPTTLNMLCKALEKHTSLIYFNFNAGRINYLQFKQICESFKENTVIETLCFGFNHLIPLAGKALCDTLLRNPSIKKLSLKENTLRDIGIELLYDALIKHSLTSLNLWGNNIEVDGFKKLAAFLEEDTTLKKLNLGYNHGGRAGVKAILTAAEKNTTLLDLNLAGNYTPSSISSIHSGTFKKTWNLSKRNKKFDAIRESISNTYSMITQGNTNTEITTMLNDIEENIEALKRKSAPVKPLEAKLHELVIHAHLNAFDMTSALVYYENHRENSFIDPIVPLSLAEYLYSSHCSTSSYERNTTLLATLALLKEAWQLPIAQQLIAKVIHSLHHPKAEESSIGKSCSDVVGVDKVIPLEKISCSITTDDTGDEKGSWNIIKMHLSNLSAQTLYELCQLPPLATTLETEVGTKRVTSFFHLLVSQNEYPLNTEINTLSSTEIKSDFQHHLQTIANESLIEKHSKEVTDKLGQALNELIEILKFEEKEKTDDEEEMSSLQFN